MEKNKKLSSTAPKPKSTSVSSSTSKTISTDNRTALDVKLQLTSINEKLDTLEHIIENRCSIIMKMLVMTKLEKDADEVYDNIVNEFNGMKQDIIEYRNKVQVIVDSGKIQDPEVSSLSGEVKSTKGSVASYADDKKIGDNLRSMMLIVAKFESENKKLKDDNKKLHLQMLELVHSVLGVGVKEEIFKSEEPPRESKDLSTKSESATKKIKIKPSAEEIENREDINYQKILIEIKADFEEAFMDYIPHFDSSLILGTLTIHDQSFTFQEETIELNDQEWHNRINALKHSTEQLTLVEAKLLAIRSILAENDI